MSGAAPSVEMTSGRRLAEGKQWRVSEVICRAGPSDAPFEEVHDWVSMAMVLDGSFVYRSGEGRALMTPGSVLLGNHGTCFCCSHEHGRGDWCVAFHSAPELVEEIAGDIKGVRSARFRTHRLAPNEALATAFASARSLLAGASEQAAEEAAIAVVGRLLALAHDGEEKPISFSDERRMAKAVARINLHYDKPQSLDDMAQAAGLGRHHFLRVFRRVVGVTPYRYLLTRRLEAAAIRLRAGDGDVLSVALACGFSDLSDFTRRFKRHVGTPPGEFARQLRR